MKTVLSAVAALLAAALLAGCVTVDEGADQAANCAPDRKPETAINSCTAVIRSGMFSDNPRNLAIAHYIRGVAYGRLGDYRRAVQDYDRAIGLDPDYAWAYQSRGSAHERLGEYGLALQDFDEAIRLDPKSASACNCRAWTLYLMGRNTEALADTDRALSLDPQDAPSIDTRAHVLAALGRRDEAAAEFERAMRMGGAQYVREYQAALKKHGYYRGGVNGTYDPDTRTALAACLDAGCRLRR